jgi:hypothetical protein
MTNAHNEQNLQNKDNGHGFVTGRERVHLAWVPLQAGCLTFTMAVIAILVGLWLDATLGTAPRWTLILLIGSAPIALGGVYLMVRRVLRKTRAAQDADPTPPEENM